MIRKFYYFPYRKHVPYILYQNNSIFKTRIFENLYNKMGLNTWRLLLRKNLFFSFLFELIPSSYVKTNCYVPNSSIKLIYYGFDSIIHFSMNDNNEIIEIFKKNDSFQKEKFYGHSLNIYNDKEIENNKQVLISFFKSHWHSLKAGKHEIHGDLVPPNICIKNKEITLIDRDIKYSESIIFDLVYFYCYSIMSIENRKFLNKKSKIKITNIINEIMLSVLEDENPKQLLKSIDEINLNNIPFTDFHKYRNIFISEIIKKI